MRDCNSVMDNEFFWMKLKGPDGVSFLTLGMLSRPEGGFRPGVVPGNNSSIFLVLLKDAFMIFGNGFEVVFKS